MTAAVVACLAAAALGFWLRYTVGWFTYSLPVADRGRFVGPGEIVRRVRYRRKIRREARRIGRYMQHIADVGADMEQGRSR